MKKFKKLIFFSAYFINIALAKGLWDMTENYWLKFLGVMSPLLILGAINGHNSSNRVRTIGLSFGVLGICIYAYFVEMLIE